MPECEEATKSLCDDLVNAGNPHIPGHPPESMKTRGTLPDRLILRILSRITRARVEPETTWAEGFEGRHPEPLTRDKHAGWTVGLAQASDITHAARVGLVGSRRPLAEK
jgi:hypothetical protein